MRSLRSGVIALFCIVSAGCVLHAHQFLPATGRYASFLDTDGGWRSDVIVVTDTHGPWIASARIWSVDAGLAPGIDASSETVEAWIQSNASRSSILAVNRAKGTLETAAGSTVLPDPVVVGALWRTKASKSAACFVDSEVVRVTQQTAEVTHRFGCEDESPQSFMRSVWEVGAGEVEFGLLDGGAAVRFVRIN